MKLKNKKTGEIRELPHGFFCGDNLKKICEEWEDASEESKENEYISHEVFISEYANDDFWGRIPYLIGVNDGMSFVYKIIEKTVDSGATPDPKIIKANIENALKQKNMLEKELKKLLDRYGGEE